VSSFLLTTLPRSSDCRYFFLPLSYFAVLASSPLPLCPCLPHSGLCIRVLCSNSVTSATQPYSKTTLRRSDWMENRCSWRSGIPRSCSFFCDACVSQGYFSFWVVFGCCTPCVCLYSGQEEYEVSCPRSPPAPIASHAHTALSSRDDE